MPRVRPLIQMDPREMQVKMEIGGILKCLGMTNKQLAEAAGIKPSTLAGRIGKNGKIGDMRLSELWAIQDVGKKGGVIP